MIKLSVVVITLNEENNIKRCLSSVSEVADEILVVDSNSTDKTVEYSEALGARVAQHPFTDYVDQRIVATQMARHDWVLSIDADEALSEELINSIKHIKQSPESNVYKLNRCTNYCGKWIKHGTWYPDKKIRLFNRTKGTWKGAKVHEYWEAFDKNENIKQLKGDILHYSFNTISDHIKQIEKFTEMSALAAVEKGKTCSLLKVWLGPKWYFINSFILKLGFLDGYYGYLVCKYSAMSSMIKYTKIRQYTKQ